MTKSSHSFFGHVPVICGMAVVLPSAAILLGWYLRLPSLRSPFHVGHPITPWGALLFLLLGLSVIVFARWNSHPQLRAFAVLSAGFVLLHSGATIAEYLSGRDFGFDSLFMRSRVLEWWVSPAPLGRYALIAAFAFAGLSTALLTRNRRIYRVWPTELLALVVGALALLGLVGYAYGVHSLSGLGQKVWMARNGAVMFGALALGTFFLRRDRGIAGLVTARDAGGIAARRLVATNLVSLFVLGWVAIHGVRNTFATVEIATASLVVASIITTAILILATASVLHRMETARQRDSLALQESAQRLQLATDAAELGVWTWDPATDEVFCSRQAKKIWGIREESDSFKYEFLMSRVHPEDRERLRSNGFKSASGDYVNEYRVVRDDAAVRWIAVRGRRIQIQLGHASVFGVTSDITDRKLSEQALIRNEKLASVGRMAASIAHEVNNPLAAVMNLLYLCRTDASVSAGTRQYLVNAEAELARLAHITRQTLGFYRERSSPDYVSVGELVRQVCELYRRRAEQNAITIARRLRPDVSTVFANAGEIRQVVSNLVVNAADAMGEGGVLHVRLAEVNSNVKITIADTGCGIDRNYADHVFEPFFTTKATGTGLGLWICRQIVERHGGKIRVRTKPGNGTVFIVTLPSCSGPRPETEAPSLVALEGGDFA